MCALIYVPIELKYIVSVVDPLILTLNANAGHYVWAHTKVVDCNAHVKYIYIYIYYIESVWKFNISNVKGRAQWNVFEINYAFLTLFKSKASHDMQRLT